jgi:hypothetical protein
MGDTEDTAASPDGLPEKMSAHARTVIEDIRDRVFVRGRESVDLEDGLVAILVPRFDGPLLRRFLMPRLRHPNFRITLDASGSFVWKMLDGQMSVGDIARAWAADNPGEEVPLARVALFVRALAMQGHVNEVDLDRL